MTVARFAISLDKELARMMRKSAAGEPISAWLADAARRRLRAEGLLDVINDWERQHGEITLAELRATERRQRAALKKRR